LFSRLLPDAREVREAVWRGALDNNTTTLPCSAQRVFVGGNLVMCTMRLTANSFETPKEVIQCPLVVISVGQQGQPRGKQCERGIVRESDGHGVSWYVVVTTVFLLKWKWFYGSPKMTGAILRGESVRGKKNVGKKDHAHSVAGIKIHETTRGRLVGRTEGDALVGHHQAS